MRMTRQAARKAVLASAFLFFPIYMNLFSPYVIIDGAFQGIVSGSFAVFMGLFVLSLFAGRGFCGWGCPMGGYQELLAKANGKAPKGGRWNLAKYAIWVPWFGIVLTGGIMAGGFRRLDLFHLMDGGISVSRPEAWVIYFMVVGVITAVPLLAGRRAFCRYVCWIGVFQILGSKIRSRFRWPSLHLEADKTKCARCGSCDRKCPMGLGVSAMVQAGSMANDECVLCGSCVDACPRKAIRFAGTWAPGASIAASPACSGAPCGRQ
jgi:polyferredoxin